MKKIKKYDNLNQIMIYHVPMYLQNLINEKVKTQQEIQLFDEEKNMYKSELKQCVYELLQYQVSAAKVH